MRQRWQHATVLHWRSKYFQLIHDFSSFIKYIICSNQFTETNNLIFAKFHQMFFSTYRNSLATFSDPNLCSHVYALCYMAQSLFDHENPLVAASCDEVCPHLSVFQLVKGFNAPDYLNPHSNSIDSDIPENIVFGMNISDRYTYDELTNNSPKILTLWNRFATEIKNRNKWHLLISGSARGSYCLLNVRRPFCSMNKNKIGSRRCCSFAEMFADSDNSKLNFNLKLHWKMQFEGNNALKVKSYWIRCQTHIWI